MNDVISAISTPAGTGGVAIIRMSGKGALDVAEKTFRPTGKVAVKDFLPYRMYTGHILCDGFSDFGMCVYFAAPKSFTGEDCVELHCHGGAYLARSVLKTTIKNGARLADRGEFTKRAFVNGKITLASAEGMIDMINAESLAELKAGSMLYGGRLNSEVRKIQDELKDILAGISADIDYPEEGIEETDLRGTGEKLSSLADEVNALAAGYSAGKLIKNGVTVAICGKPNVGKSSLLNALLGYDKAIVSPTAGTTRDAVEGVIVIDGVKYNLCDTAGIRDGAGEIEEMGISRAKDILASADVVLSVADDGDFSAAGSGENVIKVANKSDAGATSAGADIYVSAKTGDKIGELRALLSQKAVDGRALDGAFLMEERHFSALKRAYSALKEAASGTEKFPLDVVSLDIREAWRILGEITGETADEAVVDTVFAKFCVGK